MSRTCMLMGSSINVNKTVDKLKQRANVHLILIIVLNYVRCSVPRNKQFGEGKTEVRKGAKSRNQKHSNGLLGFGL